MFNLWKLVNLSISLLPNPPRHTPLLPSDSLTDTKLNTNIAASNKKEDDEIADIECKE